MSYVAPIHTTKWMQGIAQRAVQNHIPVCHFVLHNGRWCISNYTNVDNETDLLQYLTQSLQDVCEKIRCGVGWICYLNLKRSCHD